MRRCQWRMPCVRGLFILKCRIDGHVVKPDDECVISDDNSKLLDLFPIQGIMEVCENCASYEPINDEVYQGTCPKTPGEYHQSFDKCREFTPKPSVLEAAEKERFSPWDS